MSFVANTRLDRLRQIASVLILVLVVRILAEILLGYGNYFPANFSEGFLAGRRAHFHSWYRAAFYLHITVGPITLILAYLLQFSGGLRRHVRTHRVIGKLQFLLIVLAVAPSGLVMATEANTGPIAGWGLGLLSVLTAATTILAVLRIRSGNVAAHQSWANRCFILLNSPLILRLNSGACYMLGIESDLTYQASAWLSWLLPLMAYEFYRTRIRDNVLNLPVFSFSSINPR